MITLRETKQNILSDPENSVIRYEEEHFQLALKKIPDVEPEEFDDL